MPVEPEILKWKCEMVYETKVAENIELGMLLKITTLFGIGNFKVDSLDLENGKATAIMSKTKAFLVKREDGWYDQQFHINEDCIPLLAKLE